MAPSPSLLLLLRRSVAGDLESVPQTFSSWNSCMSKAYCKWPAIVGIVLASLMVLSIVWCCARCLCCGLSCCCDCLSCCDSCGGRRRKSPRYENAPPVFVPYQGYQAAPPPPVYGAPQYASFDAPTKSTPTHEDSLPAMPTWGSAPSRRVFDESQHHDDEEDDDDMEMGNLGQPSGRPTALAASAARPARGRYTQLPAPANVLYEDPPAHYNRNGPSHWQDSDVGMQRLAAEDVRQSPYDPAPSPASPGRPPTYFSGSGDPSQPTWGGRTPYGRDSISPHRYEAPTPNWDHVYRPTSPAFESTAPAYAMPEPYSSTNSTRYAPTTTLGPFASTAPPVTTPGLLQVGRRPVQGTTREV